MTTPAPLHMAGGDVFASREDRTITGLLVPFGEAGATNLGRLTVMAGDIALPADPAIVGLNTDHDRTSPVGRAVALEERTDGIYATYAVARTPEGDAALADALDPNGQRRKLSAEFGPAVIKAGRLVAGHAKLWGSALVPSGAFPSAQVLAADTPDAVATPAAEVAADTTTRLDVEAPVLPTEVAVTTPAGDTGTYLPQPTEPTTQGDANVTATAVSPTVTSVTTVVPSTLTPPVSPALAAHPGYKQVLAAMANFRANPNDHDAHQVLAALSDIKISGVGALPAPGVLQPNWVDEVASGVPYVREYITLGKLGTNITAEGKKGFKVKRGTAEAPVDKFVGDWDGNKADIESGAGFTQPLTSTLKRFALGNDIGREFYDLPGGLTVLDAFLRLVVEDHLRWSDEKALASWIATAGAPVAPKVYPTNYPGALGMLIQGSLAVKRRKADGRRDVPTFAIANEAAFEELAYAAGGEQNLPAFVSLNLSTAGNGTVDGTIKVVQGDTGIEDSASVIVGSDYAIEFDELAGGPLKIDALDIARGGIDKAIHGYLQTFIARPEAVVLVGTADAP
ncbi:MAG TPA: hypothetical protein VFU07_09685 [Candidatus Lumbricidophila sp.]|nr:hypothetical protein [Candidatus Lumbricidophila sp.]